MVTWRVPRLGVQQLEHIVRATQQQAEKHKDATFQGAHGTPIKGLFKLTTCQRVVYAITPASPEAINALGSSLGLPGQNPGFDPHDPEVFTGAQAVRHLMEVASSLDALMPGEKQIFSQFRTAIRHARENGRLDVVLDRVLDRVVRAARVIQTEVGSHAGRESVVPLTETAVADHLGDLERPRAVVIGTGVIAKAFINMLRRHRPDAKIILVSRDLERAERMAHTMGVIPMSLGGLHKDPPQGIGLIGCAMRSQEPILRASAVERLTQRADGPLLVLDFAMPRNVEDPGRLPGLRIITMEDMARLGKETRDQRLQEIQHAQRILDHQLERYMEKERLRHEKERLRRLTHRFEQIATERWNDLPLASPQLEENDHRLHKWYEQTVRALRHEAIDTIKQAGKEGSS